MGIDDFNGLEFDSEELDSLKCDEEREGDSFRLGAEVRDFKVGENSGRRKKTKEFLSVADVTRGTSNRVRGAAGVEEQASGNLGFGCNWTRPKYPKY